MTSADDDDINDAGQRLSGIEFLNSHATVTDTSVGLVTMSNTAERFWD